MKSNRLKKVLVRPYTYISDSTGVDAIKMCVMLLIQVILLAFTKSFRSIFIILASVLASVLADILDKRFKSGIEGKGRFCILISVVQGLITGFLLPETYPVLSVFFVTFFTMLITKYMFGGFSRSWINPSIITVAILWIIGRKVFPDFLVNYELLSMRNPSQLLIESGAFSSCRFDTSITDSLNNTIFSLFKVSIPEGYVSLFWDTGSIIPAFRFNLISIISTIVLFSDDYIKTLAPLAFLFVYFVLVRFVSPLFFGTMSIRGDLLLAFLTGGTLFFTAYVINWYGTNPQTIWGKVSYGAITGLAAFFIAGPGTSPCGLVFAVLLSNVFSVIIRQIESRYDEVRIEKLVLKRQEA